MALPVTLVASALNLPIETVFVTAEDKHKYKNKLPTGQFPTLESADGEILFEPFSIMRFLCNQYPNNTLMGTTLLESTMVE
jgi:glutathione S-transferase